MKHAVSIIICTRNRAASLKLTLESVSLLEVPSEASVEVLVVDNGSTDNTEAVVREAGSLKVPFQYLKEPRTGQNRAYNAGMGAARGNVLLWTDDDVRVPVNWVETMCQPIWRDSADAVVGGVKFPRHIDDLLRGGILERRRSWFASSEEINPEEPARMIGANMAFHRRVLERIPEFDVELGPGALGFGGETLFSYQLLAAGFRLAGRFDPPVEHHFDTTRLTRSGLLDLARKMGRSRAYLFHHWHHNCSALAVPRLVLCHARHFLRRQWERSGGEVISEQMLSLEENLAFYEEYLKQRRRSFKYSRCDWIWGSHA